MEAPLLLPDWPIGPLTGENRSAALSHKQDRCTIAQP